MIIGFNSNTEYVAGNLVWFWGATVGFPSGDGNGGGWYATLLARRGLSGILHRTMRGRF